MLKEWVFASNRFAGWEVVAVVRNEVADRICCAVVAAKLVN